VEIGRFESDDGVDPVDVSLGAGDEVGLGEVESVKLV
jgi:hypothetical protein